MPWVYPLLRHPDGRAPRISSGFGSGRPATIAAPAHSHKGVDLMYRRPAPVSATVYKAEHGSENYELAPGSAVVAASDGKVTSVGKTLLGTHIIISHAGDLSTFYQHLDVANVKKGDHVVMGQQIGVAGHGSLGDIRHLHFEVRAAGKAFDPEDAMKKWGVLSAPVGGFVANDNVPSALTKIPRNAVIASVAGLAALGLLLGVGLYRRHGGSLFAGAAKPKAKRSRSTIAAAMKPLQAKYDALTEAWRNTIYSWDWDQADAQAKYDAAKERSEQARDELDDKINVLDHEYHRS